MRLRVPADRDSGAQRPGRKTRARRQLDNAHRQYSTAELRRQAGGPALIDKRPAIVQEELGRWLGNGLGTITSWVGEVTIKNGRKMEKSKEPLPRLSVKLTTPQSQQVSEAAKKVDETAERFVKRAVSERLKRLKKA